jgi:hypothetical protein
LTSPRGAKVPVLRSSDHDWVRCGLFIVRCSAIKLALQSVVSGHADPATAARFRYPGSARIPTRKPLAFPMRKRGDRNKPVATAGGYSASSVLPWNMRTVMT